MTRAELDDERGFLLDSLEDLEREHAAGDLSDADYAVLRDRYTMRAAEVLRALDRTDVPDTEGDAAGDGGRADPARASGPTATRGTAIPRVRRHRGVLVAGSVVLVAALAVTVVVTQTGVRLPGETATGSVRLSGGEQQRRTLAQAETLESDGNASEALRLFLQVLSQDPDQPEALAQSGWLEYEAGVKSKNPALLSDAQKQEEAAQRAAPGAYAPHLYLGTMLLAEGDSTGAVAQYRQFLADGPPSQEVLAAQAFITDAFRRAGEPVPTLPGTTPTTATSQGG